MVAAKVLGESCRFSIFQLVNSPVQYPVIGRFYYPLSGQVTLDGVPINGFNVDTKFRLYFNPDGP